MHVFALFPDDVLASTKYTPLVALITCRGSLLVIHRHAHRIIPVSRHEVRRGSVSRQWRHEHAVLELDVSNLEWGKECWFRFYRVGHGKKERCGLFPGRRVAEE